MGDVVEIGSVVESAAKAVETAAVDTEQIAVKEVEQAVVADIHPAVTDIRTQFEGVIARVEESLANGREHSSRFVVQVVELGNNTLKSKYHIVFIKLSQALSYVAAKLNAAAHKLTLAATNPIPLDETK